ncbi:MAG: flagellar M-ring protein FliF [Chloroflexi bacterium]|nr:flagellar M-ring protein FliF [Chloroflexota bacterium]
MTASLRKQLSLFWQHQSKSQRLTLIALLLAAMIIVPVLISWANAPSYVVAFSGLSETDAGQIAQALDGDNIPYQLRDSSTILVPSKDVYSVRLRMATQGLPQSGTVGYELFSGNTLGMTEFTQRVNYQRALEGELERTIGSLDAVEAVRVHVVTPEKTLLSEEQAPTTASITIKVRPGKSLDHAQVQSITHLVASSVEGLAPENVAIIDTNGNMLASGASDGIQGASLTQADSHRAAELAASADLQNKIQSLLDSVLGPNRSVVQASVLLDWTQREVTSQTFDPTPAAIRSSQKVSEIYGTSGDNVGGIPGAGSNLPTPVATVAAGGAMNNYQHTEETINYEITQSQTHEVVSPGQVKSVSLSVLVDGVTDQQQIDTLKKSVAAAAGIDEGRGDILSVETLAFDRSYIEQQSQDLAQGEKTSMYYQIGEGVGAALLLGLLLWFMLRLFKNLRLASAQAWIPVMKPVSEAALISPGAMPLIASGSPAGATRDVPQPGSTSASISQDDQMQRVLAHMTEENPANVAEIIQMWLNEDGKQHA